VAKQNFREKTMQSIRLWGERLLHIANRATCAFHKGSQTWRQIHVPSIRRRSKPVANAGTGQVVVVDGGAALI
jgi:hypothetical protein